MTTDAVRLTADLIRCPSVTPDEGGALTLLGQELGAAGFACTRVDRGGVANLFARWGKGAILAALASTVIPMWCRRAMRPPGPCRPLQVNCAMGCSMAAAPPT